MDCIFIAYLRVRNFRLVSRVISLASNSQLFIGQVRHAPVAVWKIDSIIIFFM